MADQDEPMIHRVAVRICANCIAGDAGCCHAPGCLFCRFDVADTPQPLKYMIEYLDAPTPELSSQ